MNNIDVFRDTQDRIRNNDRLRELTQTAIQQTYVIDEGFISDKKPSYPDTRVSFEESLTLITAFRFADDGKKTAVLNFANPIEPGGGVLRGANAQEEYLCRASNLYNCLSSPQAQTYYDYHQSLLETNPDDRMVPASDKIVYTPDVTFFKEDRNYQPDEGCRPVQAYTAQWRMIDVITCAAPYFMSEDAVLPAEELSHLFRRRIRNILEAAISNGVCALVLGAFGCGAFHNPPSVVAKAFQDVLTEERYRHAFTDVVFAVKRTGVFCENIEAFEIAFSVFPPTGEHVFSEERNQRRFFE